MLHMARSNSGGGGRIGYLLHWSSLRALGIQLQHLLCFAQVGKATHEETPRPCWPVTGMGRSHMLGNVTLGAAIVAPSLAGPQSRGVPAALSIVRKG